MNIKRMGLILVIAMVPVILWAASSENYSLDAMILDGAGNTYSGSGKIVHDVLGGFSINQSFGEVYSIQSGFFNDYFLLPPTPTVTSTITATLTPIRSFGGEVTRHDRVFAAPNPIRGGEGKIYFDLAMPAVVEVKIYTAHNQLVLSRRLGELPAGQNLWRWQIGDIANGVYLLRLKAKNSDGKTTVVLRKIIIIK